MTVKDNESTVSFLIGRFMDTEFSEKFLANVCQETFDALVDNLQFIFEGLELTRDDIKDAWREWFDWATSNGTLICPYLRYQAEEPYMHPELHLADEVIRLLEDSLALIK